MSCVICSCLILLSAEGWTGDLPRCRDLPAGLSCEWGVSRPDECTHRREQSEQVSSPQCKANNCAMGRDVSQTKLILRETKPWAWRSGTVQPYKFTVVHCPRQEQSLGKETYLLFFFSHTYALLQEICALRILRRHKIDNWFWNQVENACFSE